MNMDLISVPDIPIQPEPSNKLALAVILGASIGSVVGLAFIIVAICLYRRRRRRPQGKHKTIEYENECRLTYFLIYLSYRTRTRAGSFYAIFSG